MEEDLILMDSYGSLLLKRIFGNPSQMICVCNENGVDAFYDFDLV